MKNLFYLLMIALLSGCSLKQEITDINSYSIDFNSKNKSYQNSSKSIMIEDPLVNNSFNSRSIFYSTKPYLFEEYAKNRWINVPSNMIYNQLLDSFSSSKLFTNVISKDSKLEHKYNLKTDIIKLYHAFENDKSYAILKIKFDLIEDKKVIKSYSYDKKVLCKTNDAYGFVEALNKSFEEVVNDLLNNFSFI